MDTTWRLCMSAVQYSWKRKVREAGFYVGEKDFSALYERLIDAGFKIEIVGTITATSAKKIIIKWGVCD